MTDQAMTLTERLLNPQWIEGQVKLDTDFTVQTMTEAAAEMSRLRSALEFYRDGFSYSPRRSKTGVNLSEWKPKDALLDDCGNRAKDALAAD